MTNTAMLLLWISLGLSIVFFLAIVGTWIYSYYMKRTTEKTNEALEQMLGTVFALEGYEQNIVISRKLLGYVRNSWLRRELLMKKLVEFADRLPEEKQRRVGRIVEETEIHAYLARLLSSSSPFNHALACRYIGDFRVSSLREEMLKLKDSRSNDVLYNMLLALAKLGDVEGLSAILSANSSHINLSFRAVVEVVTAFKGSKVKLIEQTIDHCDDYMRGILIKAAADEGHPSLTPVYVKYSSSDNKNLRIACIRAIAETKDSENESHLIGMLEDSEWEVRAAAAKGLEQIGTDKSIPSLGEAVKDKEWWVRQNAASSLVALPGGRKYAESIIKGEDRFASEAIVGVLEMSS
ncbi:HEAT repeat protein [Paenibacillus cellulosilyticus]|uniref:HEAT repeat protein n=1 Tax=Paenibacillus cellulosilyticus TaxID=375489 RepID=A0A2V2YZ37_9BACL|nr:HEAT repeat domain-containing protein [Paenibacillus cellulosilyticus]PWW05124.1 HEAT repeat protein [Paenibacillus cellulosilyticus]QKS48673.1 HEAT repeat domain-containing protein [Paenibacillus cellulosilyticus]